jgi:hypothetical protein
VHAPQSTLAWGWKVESACPRVHGDEEDVCCEQDGSHSGLQDSHVHTAAHKPGLSAGVYMRVSRSSCGVHWIRGIGFLF